jgi:hypothetical protein
MPQKNHHSSRFFPLSVFRLFESGYYSEKEAVTIFHCQQRNFLTGNIFGMSIFIENNALFNRNSVLQ